jgi:hypothetical protein
MFGTMGGLGSSIIMIVIVNIISTKNNYLPDNIFEKAIAVYLAVALFFAFEIFYFHK